MSRVHIDQPTVLSIISLEPKKIGGVEAFARELSRQLGERGWRSVLCFLSPPPPEIQEYFDLPNVILESLDCPANGTGYYRRLVKLIRHYRPAILHVHLISVLGPYAWLARFFGVKKIFFTDHASRPPGFTGLPRPIWKKVLFRTLMLPLTRIFCVSQYVRNSFNRLELLPDKRTTVLYNGVDIERAESGMAQAEDFRTSLDLSPDSFLVVQVGQIIPDKGVADLLAAAVLVCPVDRTVHFLFVGDGDYLEEYKNSAKSSGLTDRVTFSGPIADPLTTGVFAAADLVCQMSRWEEAFGLVIAEAMAVARPVLASRTGGIPELVEDGVTGYTVAPGDVESVAAHILEMSGQKELCKALGTAGQKICREKFNHRRNVKQLLKLYEIV